MESAAGREDGATEGTNPVIGSSQLVDNWSVAVSTSRRKASALVGRHLYLEVSIPYPTCFPASPVSEVMPQAAIELRVHTRFHLLVGYLMYCLRQHLQDTRLKRFNIIQQHHHRR